MNSPSNNVGDPRVALAVERTFLAWVRTGLAMMGFGFVVARFAVFLNELARKENLTPQVPPPPVSVWIGIMLVVLGVMVQVGSTIRYRRQLSILAGTTSVEFLRPSFGMVVAVLLILIGVLTTMQLIMRLLG